MEQSGPSYDLPAGHCVDVVSRCDGVRTSADAIKLGVRLPTAKVTEHRLQSTLVAKVTPPEVPEENYLLFFLFSVSRRRTLFNKRRGRWGVHQGRLFCCLRSIQCGHLRYLDLRASIGECIASSTKNFHAARNLLRTAVVHCNLPNKGMGLFSTQIKCSFNIRHHGKTNLRLSSAYAPFSLSLTVDPRLHVSASGCSRRKNISSLICLIPPQSAILKSKT